MGKEKKLVTPLFIVFEGIDGSGKSTQAKMLFEYLQDRDYSCVHLVEPTDGAWGKKIREILKSGVAPEPEEQLRLFMLDREDDVDSNIKPALDRGHIIVMDRYYYSTAAYQGAGGLDEHLIVRQNRESGFPEPDRVYFIDLPPEQALERITQRNGEEGKEIFEKKSFLSRVRSIFLDLADENFTVIDGSLPPDEIASLIVRDLFTHFSL